ncbi:MAG: hypothetical protein LH660_07020 [Phormidesmis sp. CAN_BIN36]|nr:hypothetical protein [Phormidesmis sp. CAN_BIN36]
MKWLQNSRSDSAATLKPTVPSSGVTKLEEENSSVQLGEKVGSEVFLPIPIQIS